MTAPGHGSASGGRSPLSHHAPGQPLRLVAVDAGRAAAVRLAAMGLLPGVRVDLVRRAGRGPVVVAVKGVRIALGRGMADKVLVTPWSPP